MSLTRLPWSGPVARFFAVAVTYFAAARLGVAFVVEPEGVAVFWPPAGLLIGYLLVAERRNWPTALAATVAATVVANMSAGKGFVTSIGFGVVNAIEPVLGAWVLTRRGPFALRSPRDLVSLFGIPGSVCAVAALGGAATAHASGAPFWSVWKVWWLADALGVVLFAPLVLCWSVVRTAEHRRSPWGVLEALVMLAVLAAVSWAIFATRPEDKHLLFTLPYPVFPVLLWIAVRLEACCTSLAVVLVALVAVWGSSRGLGPVSVGGLAVADRVLVVQGFCAVVSLSVLLLTIAINERREREQEIQGLNESLRQGLSDRQVALDQSRAQQQVLETILDSMGEAVLVTDASGRVRLTNRAFRSLYLELPERTGQAGWAHAYGVYRPDGKTLCPDDELPLLRAMRGESCDDVELLIQNAAHPDGVLTSTTARPILGPSETEGGVISIRDISALHRAQRAIEQKEQQYRLLLNGVRDYAICLLDERGQVASWTAGAEQITGYSENEITGRHVSIFYPPGDTVRADDALKSAAADGRYEEEGWRVRKDGTRFVAHIITTAIRNELGQLVGFAKVTQDMTAARAAASAVRHSEERFRAIFDQTLQFIGLMAPDGTLLEANRTALAAIGLREDQVLGQKFWDTPWWTHDTAQQDQLRDAVRRAALGETIRFPVYHLGANGSKIWVDFSLKPYVSAGVVTYLIPEGRDVTPLRNAEANARALIESAPDALLIVDADARIVGCNTATERLFGYERLELLGKPPELLLPGFYRGGAPALGTSAGGGVELLWKVREIDARIRDGRTIPCEVALNLVDLDDRLSVYVSIRDISERKQDEKQLAALNHRLRLLLESSEDGIYGIDLSGRCTFINQSAARMLDWTPDELLGQNMHQAVHFSRADGSEYPQAECPIFCSFQTGSSCTVHDEVFWRRNRTAFPVEYSSHPLVDAGERIGAVVFFRDLTERQQAERTLAASEALLNQFVKHAPAAIAMLDTEMRYIRTSDRWVADYRLGEQGVIGRSHYDVFPDIPERWKEVHKRVLAGAVEGCPEDPFPRADGGTEWLQWEARPWRNAKGAVGGLIFFTQVVTARVEAARRSALRLEIAGVLSGNARPLSDVLVDVIRRVCGARGWELGEYWSVCSAGAPLTLAAWWSAPEVSGFHCTDSREQFALGDGLPGRVWAGERPEVITGLAEDLRFVRQKSAAECGLRTGIGLPATINGRVTGVFVFLTRQKAVPTGEDLVAIEELAGLFAAWAEQQRAEAALAESEARFRAVFDASPAGLVLAARNGQIVLANDFAHRQFGWEQDELVGVVIEQLVPERYRGKHTKDRNGFFAAPQTRAMGAGADLAARRRDGREFPAEVGLTPINLNGEQFVLASIVDITPRKQAQAALRLGEERLRLALENAKHGLWDWDVASGRMFCDDTWLAVHGSPPGAAHIDRDWWEANVHPDDRAGVLAAQARSLGPDDAPFDVEYRARHANGGWVWVNSRGRVQSRDAAGNATRVLGTLHDATSRKQGEADLLRSVREKEVMLREIHHRVKNNLAVISSLFRMQARAAGDMGVKAVLLEAQTRVLSMALVHEHLYNSADLGAVAFDQYAKTLASQIVQTYQLPTTPIDITCDTHEVRLTVEQSIPCGLILNEVLSNCVKHAFPGRSRGTITLFVAVDGESCVIRVRDDGVGVPADLDLRLSKSLGVRLIGILTRQLLGTIEYLSPGSGTEVRLVFPLVTA